MSLSRRFLVVLLVGVCILSAGLGSGITLLAKTGPAGPAGPAGPRGLRGPAGQTESPLTRQTVRFIGSIRAGLEEMHLDELKGTPPAALDVEVQQLQTDAGELWAALGYLCLDMRGVGIELPERDCRRSDY